MTEIPRAPGLPRKLGGRLFWLGDCLLRYHPRRKETLHAYHSVFVLTGDRYSAVIDSGHPKDWAVINTQLAAIEAEGVPPVRYIVPTHPEVPHSGSLGRWLERFPQAEVFGEIRDYPFIFPEYANRLVGGAIGDLVDLGGLSFEIIEAPIRDLPPTIWVYSREEKTLFPADGFAYLHEHRAGQCGKLAEEVPELPLEELTAMFSEAALYFTRFTEMDPLIHALDSLLDRYPSEIIAPAHGLPIMDPEAILPRVREGLRLGSSWDLGNQGGVLPEQ